jgi:hypothetical protein
VAPRRSRLTMEAGVGDRHYILTVAREKRQPQNDGYIAVISRGGHPQLAPTETCEVLTLKIVPNMKAARAWFRRMKIERPWETRQ